MTGVLVAEPTPRSALPPASRAPGSIAVRPAVIRAHAVKFDRAVFARCDSIHDREPRACLGDTDACSWRSTSSRTRCSASSRSASHTCLRFSSGLIPVTRGYPPFEQYVAVMPFVAVLVPLAYYFQGVYRLRRGRSRVDDFFLVFIGTVVAVDSRHRHARCTSTRTTRRPRSRPSAPIRSRASSGRCSWSSTSR